MTARSLALFALLAAQTVNSPKFVVPDTPDFTITTRRTIDAQHLIVETEILSFKGARQRRESIVEVQGRGGERHVRATITQCDERRTLILNPETRTYAYLPIRDMSALFRPGRSVASRVSQLDAAEGGDVTIIVDAVDTGERRQVGPYLARHVITTTTTKPGPGASSRAAVRAEDGWYIDLPSGDCWDWGENGPRFTALAGLVISGERPRRDRVHVEHRGTARRGYPIEQTNRETTDTSPFSTKVELVELSDAPLADELFRLPAGYRPALQDLYGGFDLTKADTLVNRLELYWTSFRNWAQSLFR